MDRQPPEAPQPRPSQQRVRRYMFLFGYSFHIIEIHEIQITHEVGARAKAEGGLGGMLARGWGPTWRRASRLYMPISELVQTGRCTGRYSHGASALKNAAVIGLQHNAMQVSVTLSNKAPASNVCQHCCVPLGGKCCTRVTLKRSLLNDFLRRRARLLSSSLKEISIPTTAVRCDPMLLQRRRPSRFARCRWHTSRARKGDFPDVPHTWREPSSRCSRFALMMSAAAFLTHTLISVHTRFINLVYHFYSCVAR